MITKSVSVVCKNLSVNSNYEIIIDNPALRLYLLPYAKFSAKKVQVRKKDAPEKLYAENLNIKIRLLPLFSRTVHINRIECNNLNLNIKINENIFSSKRVLEEIQHSKVLADAVRLNVFRIELHSDNNSCQNPVYEGTEFLYRKKNRYIKLKTNSTLKINGQKSCINLNLHLPKNSDINNTAFEVDIKDLDIFPFGDYVRTFINKDVTSLSGIINAKADKNGLTAYLKNCAVNMKNSSDSMILPEDTYIKSKFSISANEILLKDFIFDTERIHLSVTGKIRDYLSKSMPVLDVNIVINRSKTEDFIKMIPPFRVEEFDTFSLKKYIFYGDVLGNLSVRGRMPEPDLYGDMFIDNGILIKPIPDAPKGAKVKLRFNGRNALYDVFVPAGGNQKVWVNGSQELYNVKYGDLTVKSTENVNLHTAQTVVNPLSEILNFVIGPVPILDVYGTGNIEITVKGNRRNPHVWGTLNFKNADANFLQMPDLILNNADAVLTFNDKNAYFETKKGQVNNIPFSIKGNCDLSGKLDFIAVSQNQPSKSLYRAIQTSTFIEGLSNYIPDAEEINGFTDINLKIYGHVKDIKDMCINKNVFAGGEISVKNNSARIYGTDIQKINAQINLDGLNSESKVTAFADGSPLNISASIKNKYADINVNIAKLNPNPLMKKYTSGENILPFISVNGKYKGRADNIEYDKINGTVTVLAPLPSSDIKFNSGSFVINNNRLNAKDVDIYILDSSNFVKTSFRVDNLFSKNALCNGSFSIKTPNLRVMNRLFKKKILPENLRKYVIATEFEKGVLDLNGKIINNGVYTEVNLGGIVLKYLPLDLPVEILEGKFTVNNDHVKFSKINMLADNMPIFVNGEVRDLFDKRNFNIYITSKPKQEFVDKYINKNQIYPLKLKGDILLKTFAKGVPSNFDFKSVIDMYKDSLVYYYGATIGDFENELHMSLESNIRNKASLKIKEFTADKIIDSPNGKKTTLNMLKITGGIDVLPDDLMLNNLKIKTSNPTDARVFNIIFGKPNIKHGRFSSDLRMSGKLSNPKILGDFHISETDIPFIDTIMKNIELVFKDKTIEISSKGEIMGNEVSVTATLKNRLIPPYHILKAEVFTGDMDLNRIIKNLKSAEAESANTQDTFGNLSFDSIVADKLKLKANNITLKNIHASNFEADTSFSAGKVFDINNFTFNIAHGVLRGKYKYNLKTNDIKLSLNADNISADDITLALFDLKNQIYGDMTGNIDLSCKGWSYEECLATLNGSSTFNVKDGRMPKLGSLEYLLKAGNLVKGGITNLSINGVIDLITPLKTGEFSDIYGSIHIKDGVADDIEISTQGKNMNLFVGGTYNFSNSSADMEVLGMISRKISTMFGPVGNLSINTMFNLIPGVDLSKDSVIRDRINKIPGIEISGKAYRKFVAEIKGNINAEDYVTSFKWIN